MTTIEKETIDFVQGVAPGYDDVPILASAIVWVDNTHDYKLALPVAPDWLDQHLADIGAEGREVLSGVESVGEGSGCWKLRGILDSFWHEKNGGVCNDVRRLNGLLARFWKLDEEQRFVVYAACKWEQSVGALEWALKKAEAYDFSTYSLGESTRYMSEEEIMEAYGRELLDCTGESFSDYLEPYFDYEQFGHDAFYDAAQSSYYEDDHDYNDCGFVVTIY